MYSKIKFIVLTMAIILLIFFGFYIKNQENKGVLNSKVRQTVQKQAYDKMENYEKYWLEKSIPSMKVTNLSNEPIIIENNSSPSLYVVWASWCPDCQRELPIIDSLYNEFSENVNFITIDLVGFKGETIEDAKRMCEDKDLSVPVFFDTTKQVYQKLNIFAIPTLFFVNNKGIIKNIIIENADESTCRKLIKNLLVSNKS
ncbi:MAG TPA: TlpA family protein disulfide reductase [Candidatus Enterococcus stercoripullorum]|nr:TlpA family protein disulfide reductase [Candidatus Enterococcus stercoripullorum]